MRVYIGKIQRLLLILFLGCYIFAMLCLADVVPFSHEYHYFFLAGSFFLIMYFLTYAYRMSKGPSKDFYKK